jgi:hypothetical protein
MLDFPLILLPAAPLALTYFIRLWFRFFFIQTFLSLLSPRLVGFDANLPLTHQNTFASCMTTAEAT